MNLKSYRKINDDTLYLDFAPVPDDDGHVMPDRLAVVARAADGEEIGRLCVVTPDGIERSYLGDSDERLDIFDTDETGHYNDITDTEEYY